MAFDILPPGFRASPEFNAQPPSTPEQQGLTPTETYPEGFDFKSLQEKVQHLEKTGKSLSEKALSNRRFRVMEVDNEAERARGRFKPDEIYIPYHVINDNISKEAGSYIAFITGSKNAAIFKQRGTAAITNNETLEREFTSAVRYEGYEQETFGLIDGFQLHGIDYVEVLYDETKPGFFSIEHLAYENVWYPQKVQRGKFQASPIVVRNCEMTKEQLMKFPNVNKEQVELLFKDIPKNDPEREFISIQKVQYRVNGIVNVCWMDCKKSTDFIRAPQPLHMGRMNIIKDPITGVVISSEKLFETQYFIVPFPYQMTENKCLIETQGRARLDQNTQEAVSSLVSSIVNAWHRACQTMGSPEDPTPSPEIVALDAVIEGGRLYNKKINFWSHPYPDAEGMNIVNSLLTQNKAETAQMNLAVGNRSDYASRKTAKEIQVAERKEGELTTTQIVLFASSWREVLSLCWLIMKAQIELGVIKTEIPSQILQQDLVLMTAGETEVVQRQEILANLQNLWPIVASTPAAMTVLEDILRLMVPSSADKYIAMLRGGAMDDKMVIQRLMELVKAIATEHPEVIPPDAYPQLEELMAAAQAAVNTNTVGQEPAAPVEEGPPQEQVPA